MTDIVIASAARTAVGSFLGGLGTTPAHVLGAAAIEAAIARAGIDKAEVSETILGQVLTAAQGQNPARQAHILAGLPESAAAWASIRSAAPACGPWRWLRNTFSLATPRSWSPAARKA